LSVDRAARIKIGGLAETADDDGIETAGSSPAIGMASKVPAAKALSRRSIQ
jgi:hypothetical protein